MNWNTSLLHSMLVNYHDQQIVDYLQFRFPIDRDPAAILEIGGMNPKGPTEHEDHVDHYIVKELEHEVMMGLYECIPFKNLPVIISPLSTHQKRESNSRCVIMDCSWPIGKSLNDGITKHVYLGGSIELKYLTVDLVCRKIFDLSRHGTEDIYMYKEDMDRAFRQLPVDFKTVPLLGFQWRGLYYFDLVMMMGCHIAPYICQRTTNMLTYLH